MGIQDYFRKQNIFGSPNIKTPPFLPDKSVSDIFGSNTVRPPDESIDVQAGGDESESPAQDAFRESVLNPPQHRNPHWARALGVGALSALQGSNEPDLDAKTRVMVDGQAYQKRGVMIDPTTGEKKYVGGTKPRGFWESLGNKPFNTEEAGELLNIPNAIRLGDYKVKTAGLREAATLENKDEVNRALSAQRYANAANIPQRETRLGAEGAAKIDLSAERNDQAQQRIELLRQKQEHLMSRQDLSESEKAALANKYRQEQIKLQGEMQQGLQDKRGGQALEQIDARGDIQKDIQELRGSQAQEQIGVRGEQARETAGVTGEEARKTKGTVSGGAEQKVQLQLKANKARQDHPEWSKFIKTDANGMVEVSPPSTGGMFSTGPDKATYDAIVAYMDGEVAGTGTPNTSAAPAAKPTPKAAAGKTIEKIQKNNKTGATRTLISKDGGKTWSVK